VTADEHLEWRISALLDGELGVTEEIVARKHLEGCDACQQEFAEVMAARSFVRGLGDVEPPQGFLDRIATSSSSRFPSRLGLVGLVAVAAAWVLILAIGVGIGLPDVSPPVDEFAEQHLALSEASESDGLPERSDGYQRVPSASVDDLAAPYSVPSSIDAAYDRLAAYDSDDALQVLYSDGETEVSVFQQEGSLDWRALPSTGSRIELGDSEAWVGRATVGGVDQTVLVMSKGDLVYTVVTSAPSDEATALAEDLPEPPAYSVTERARKNFEQLGRRFGFGATLAPGE
jgi:hypothetical protein